MLTKTTKLRLTKTPSDGSGTFEGTIDYNPPEGDLDGERIDNWTNLPTTVPLGYQHAYGDPGAEIGSAKALDKNGRHMLVLGRLDVSGRNPMADAVYERMLLPSSDPRALRELSVGFHHDPAKSFKAQNGVSVLVDVSLMEVSIVYHGAQPTSIANVKGAKVGHGRSLLIPDESMLDDQPPRGRNDLPFPYHIEERGIGYAVVEEVHGQPIATYRTRGEAIAKLVELRANLGKALDSPAFMQRKIELAAAGKSFSPELCAAERKTWATRQEEAARSAFEHEQLAKVQRPIPDTMTWVERGSESADVAETSTQQVAAFEDGEPVRLRFGPGMRPIEEDA